MLYFFLVTLKSKDGATETQPSRGVQLLSVFLHLVSQMLVRT